MLKFTNLQLCELSLTARHLRVQFEEVRDQAPQFLALHGVQQA